MIRHNGINVVLDVGANVGQYATELRRSGYTGKIISFEPLADAFATLKEASRRGRNWEVFNIAIGAQDGESCINVAKNSYSSSLLPMLPKHVEHAPESRYKSTQSVTVRRLDTALENVVRNTDRLLLKMDTQGFEREVLRGAFCLLPQVWLVECELSLAPLYDGQALFLEMVNLLHENGLKPVYFCPGFSEQTGYCLQVDGWFAKVQ
jgi:FkbM family methyltransferase